MPVTDPSPGGARACVVMPVYNEEPTLCDVLDAVREHFDGPVVVVDDGSTDGTGGCLEGRDDIEVVRHSENAGYGRSLAHGLARTREIGCEQAVTMDCDGQHEPAHIPGFLAALGDGTDIVSGSRYLPESRACGAAPPDRAEINRRVTEAVNEFTGWALTDAFCGFKAYGERALATLELTEPGYGMPMQLWAQAHARGLVVAEMPVERIYADHDRSFGADLDDPARRERYYMRVWEDSLAAEGVRSEMRSRGG